MKIIRTFMNKSLIKPTPKTVLVFKNFSLENAKKKSYCLNSEKILFPFFHFSFFVFQRHQKGFCVSGFLWCLNKIQFSSLRLPLFQEIDSLTVWNYLRREFLRQMTKENGILQKQNPVFYFSEFRLVSEFILDFALF